MQETQIHPTVILRSSYGHCKMTVRYLFLSHETLQRSYEYPTVGVRLPHGVSAPYGSIVEKYIYSGPWMSIRIFLTRWH